MTASEPGADDYVIGVHADPAAVDGEAWDALLARQAAPTPFLRHDHLLALHASASAIPSTGWTPCWLTLERRGELMAGCALYLKRHSWGEYVFDHAWAEAYRRHGLAYYPKLVGAVPFSPVPGTRLLARDAAWRSRLIAAIDGLLAQGGWSSAHLLFVDAVDREALAAAGWLIREGVQFHWEQDAANPIADFADLLSRLTRERRKKIQQERRRVAEQGIAFTVHEGAAIDEALWDFFHRCYTRTYDNHGGHPYLTRDFFARVARTMPEPWVLFVARRAGVPVGCSLIAVDETTRAAWGRWWGALDDVACLHFEACYYQPLAWCLARGWRRFEGGAQGEHKIRRALLPVATFSAHRLRDERFAAAVADYLERETPAVQERVEELREHTPFKRG